MDEDLINKISELAAEEHQLELSHAEEGLSDSEKARLHSIEVALDQCWDLLRQRRARRGAGQDPKDVAVRPPEVVEYYKQ